ncbi:MAG: hypothetical protein ACI8TX_003177, partial [Hyphomicrobiaceae bacterium]
MTTKLKSNCLTVALTACVGFVSFSCGAGTAAIAGGGGSSAGGDIDSPAVVTGVTLNAKTSPATIGFTLTDADGGLLPVIDLFYARSGQASKPITQAIPNGSLALGVNSFNWDFTMEGDLGNGEFIDGVGIQVQVRGGTSVLAPGAFITGALQNSVADGRVGNDAPVVVSLDLGSAPELSGNVDVRIELSDTSDDFVDVVLEFKLASEPDSAFRPARSTSIAADLPAEADALKSIPATAGGSTFVFRWESQFAAAFGLPMTESQLPGLEVDVELRAIARDSVVSGSELRAMLRIDNNAPPQAVLNGSSFALGIKDRGHIPVPMQLFDAESDDLDVVLQWAADNQPFPNLPSTPDDLRDLLSNPTRATERQQLQIAVEAPLAFTGRVGGLKNPLPTNQIRLPELASTQAGLLSHGVTGRTLEIMRLAKIEPAPWGNVAGAEFMNPKMAVFHSDGRSLLVLDETPGGGFAQVIKFDMETGISEPGVFALVPGDPIALAFDPSGTRLFVATTTQLARFDSIDGTQDGVSVKLLFSGVVPRDIAPLGTDVVVATSLGSLLRIDYETGKIESLVSGLQDPHGVVLDPVDEGKLYVSERSANQILHIDLDELVPLVVAATLDPSGPLSGDAIPEPRHLAIERGGARLLVMCEDAITGDASLRSLDLRSPIDFDGALDGKADPFVREIEIPLVATGAGITTGADGARLIVSFSANLFIGGGVIQRRGVVSYDETIQVMTLDEDLAEIVGGTVTVPIPVGTPWRILAPLLARSDPAGRANNFLWDTSDVPDPLQVRLRILPIDGDLGVEGAAGRPFRPSFDASASLSTIAPPRSVAAADLDGDGDLDLVSANFGAETLTPFFQTTPGVFTAAFGAVLVGFSPRSVEAADLDGDGVMELVVVGGSDALTLFFQALPEVFVSSSTLTTGASPQSVAAADLDGDGNIDLVSADGGSDTLTLFFQKAPLPGSTEPVFTPGASTLTTGASPQSVAAADLDGDGDLDLVSADFGSSTLTLFFQGAPLAGSTEPVFTPGATTPAPGASPRDVAAADLDGDGDLDLVSANQISSTLTMFFQGAPLAGSTEPVFTPGASMPSAGTSPVSVTAADLDGDGDLDLVSANLLSDTLTLFFQSAPVPGSTEPVFTPGASPLSTGAGPSSVIAADMNGDGNIDLVSADQGLTLFLQSATQVFRQGASTLQTGSFPRDVAVADLDADGDIDLVSADGALFLQSAPGVFTPGASTLQMGVDPQAVVAADLDGDGDIDLVSADEDSKSLKLFFQEAPLPGSTEPVFTPGASTLSAGASPRAPIAADLDGDG